MSDSVTTSVGGYLIRKGDRLIFGGRPAVVKAVESATRFRFGWRDAWYWRLIDDLHADWHDAKRIVRRALYLAKVTLR